MDSLSSSKKLIHISSRTIATNSTSSEKSPKRLSEQLITVSEQPPSPKKPGLLQRSPTIPVKIKSSGKRSNANPIHDKTLGQARWVAQKEFSAYATSLDIENLLEIGREKGSFSYEPSDVQHLRPILKRQKREKITSSIERNLKKFKNAVSFTKPDTSATNSIVYGQWAANIDHRAFMADMGPLSSPITDSPIYADLGPAVSFMPTVADTYDAMLTGLSIPQAKMAALRGILLNYQGAKAYINGESSSKNLSKNATEYRNFMACKAKLDELKIKPEECKRILLYVLRDGMLQPLAATFGTLTTVVNSVQPIATAAADIIKETATGVNILGGCFDAGQGGLEIDKQTKAKKEAKLFLSAANDLSQLESPLQKRISHSARHQYMLHAFESSWEDAKEIAKRETIFGGIRTTRGGLSILIGVASIPLIVLSHGTAAPIIIPILAGLSAANATIAGIYLTSAARTIQLRHQDAHHLKKDQRGANLVIGTTPIKTIEALCLENEAAALIDKSKQDEVFLLPMPRGAIHPSSSDHEFLEADYGIPGNEGFQENYSAVVSFYRNPHFALHSMACDIASSINNDGEVNSSDAQLTEDMLIHILAAKSLTEEERLDKKKFLLAQKKIAFDLRTLKLEAMEKTGEDQIACIKSALAEWLKIGSSEVNNIANFPSYQLANFSMVQEKLANYYKNQHPPKNNGAPSFLSPELEKDDLNNIYKGLIQGPKEKGFTRVKPYYMGKTECHFVPDHLFSSEIYQALSSKKDKEAYRKRHLADVGHELFASTSPKQFISAIDQMLSDAETFLSKEDRALFFELRDSASDLKISRERKTGFKAKSLFDKNGKVRSTLKTLGKLAIKHIDEKKGVYEDAKYKDPKIVKVRENLENMENDFANEEIKRDQLSVDMHAAFHDFSTFVGKNLPSSNTLPNKISFTDYQKDLNKVFGQFNSIQRKLAKSDKSSKNSLTVKTDSSPQTNLCTELLHTTKDIIEDLSHALENLHAAYEGRADEKNMHQEIQRIRKECITFYTDMKRILAEMETCDKKILSFPQVQEAHFDNLLRRLVHHSLPPFEKLYGEINHIQNEISSIVSQMVIPDVTEEDSFSSVVINKKDRKRLEKLVKKEQALNQQIQLKMCSELSDMATNGEFGDLNTLEKNISSLNFESHRQTVKNARPVAAQEIIDYFRNTFELSEAKNLQEISSRFIKQPFTESIELVQTLIDKEGYRLDDIIKSLKSESIRGGKRSGGFSPYEDIAIKLEDIISIGKLSPEAQKVEFFLQEFSNLSSIDHFIQVAKNEDIEEIKIIVDKMRVSNITEEVILAFVTSPELDERVASGKFSMEFKEALVEALHTIRLHFPQETIEFEPALVSPIDIPATILSLPPHPDQKGKKRWIVDPESIQ
jgi:hypothetical protein